MAQLTYTREQGILAIIDLQAFAGITEPRAKAERGWDSMSEWDKANTQQAHMFFFPEKAKVFLEERFKPPTSEAQA